ncbi:MAG: TIGR03564 family F420-dependent LLM class oxidoreductase [Gammaproteobacteria bacterium]|nr:TIGR03564 family F420-dependent LLM class oxidoreductase [Gammaproteobacteria bacterium]MCP5202225.1 TIGR03564 family F420-dependent LLM class oxidoreductase [Gammaproteobacteria bacterium]
MKYGLMLGADRAAATVEAVATMAERAEAAGFDSLWMAHIRSLDAISALTVAATRTRRIELGPAVTPVYPRHPMALAQQALTANQAAAGRFTLGIGVSHRVVVEGMLGLSYARPAAYLRDYLGALLPLLQGEVTDYAGERFQVHGLQLDVVAAPPVRLLVAALGPVMLKLAGHLADGTHTWMVGPRTVAAHIAPALDAAARTAGRPAPRIVAGLPIVLTTKPAAAREAIASGLAIYGQLPSYRAMLDREGVAGPADIALVGDEATLEAGLARLAEAGVTDFNAAIMDVEHGAFDRTFEFLAGRPA